MPEAKARKKIALITGASSGLGAEFARQIEKNFYLQEIWLVARRAAPMRELAAAFTKSKAVVIPLDLTDRADLAALENRLAAENPEIVLLVNNAGYGKFGPVAELGLDEQIKMIDLNVTALTFLSRVGLAYMGRGSALIQVASSAAFSPAPYFAVYAATKSYVVSFSDALGFELRQRGIRVLAVCPGPVETEFFSVAQKSEARAGASGEPFNKALNASAVSVVEKALRDLARGKRHSIYGFTMQVLAAFSALVPTGLKLRVLSGREPKN